jgi:hypothetical protein
MFVMLHLNNIVPGVMFMCAHNKENLTDSLKTPQGFLYQRANFSIKN